MSENSESVEIDIDNLEYFEINDQKIYQIYGKKIQDFKKDYEIKLSEDGKYILYRSKNKDGKYILFRIFRFIL